MRRAVARGRPVVVKVGSSSLALAAGGVDEAAIARVVSQVCGLWDLGFPTVLVTSGAVAAGQAVLGMSRRPDDLPGLQMAAAVGQGRLLQRYTFEFAEKGRVAGQVLLTKDVLASRSQYLNARQAFERMLASGVVPVVNENDTVAVEELRLGDNDRLAALVSHLVGAGLLLLLTDTAGLYSRDPRLQEQAELISAVRHTDRVLDEVMHGTPGPLGSGGVATKVAAARMAAWSGIPTVVAEAGRSDVAARAVAGEEVGTWIAPHSPPLPARKLWIAFGQPAEGRVTVDAGAVDALTRRGTSLLAVGVIGVEGAFAVGAAVEVLGPGGALIAKGLVRLEAEALRAALGAAGTEVIHRDDLVVLVGGR